MAPPPAPQQRDLQVLRLASLTGNLTARLAARGIQIEGAAEVLNELQKVGAVVLREDLVKTAFRPRTGKTHPFPSGRFSDGSRPVFYSALSRETCEAEVVNYKAAEVKSVVASGISTGIKYMLFSISCRGRITSLIPWVRSVAALTGKTSASYPACRQIADDAIAMGAQALETPSARREGGTCVPVFEEQTLGTPAVAVAGTLTVRNNNVVFE